MRAIDADRRAAKLADEINRNLRLLDGPDGYARHGAANRATWDRAARSRQVEDRVLAILRTKLYGKA